MKKLMCFFLIFTLVLSLSSSTFAMSKSEEQPPQFINDSGDSQGGPGGVKFIAYEPTFTGSVRTVFYLTASEAEEIADAIDGGANVFSIANGAAILASSIITWPSSVALLTLAGLTDSYAGDIRDAYLTSYQRGYSLGYVKITFWTTPTIIGTTVIYNTTINAEPYDIDNNLDVVDPNAVLIIK